MKKEKPKLRSLAQNRALHKYFIMVADAFKEIEPMHNMRDPKVVKDIFKSVMKAQTGKESTAELYSFEVPNVYLVFSKWLKAEYNVDVKWPSEDELMNEFINLTRLYDYEMADDRISTPE